MLKVFLKKALNFPPYYCFNERRSLMEEVLTYCDELFILVIVAELYCSIVEELRRYHSRQLSKEMEQNGYFKYISNEFFQVLRYLARCHEEELINEWLAMLNRFPLDYSVICYKKLMSYCTQESILLSTHCVNEWVSHNIEWLYMRSQVIDEYIKYLLILIMQINLVSFVRKYLANMKAVMKNSA